LLAKVNTMKGWGRIAMWVALGVFFPGAMGSASPADDPPAGLPVSGPIHQVYDALNDLRVNSAEVYTIKDFDLRRDVVHFTFASGRLAFLEPYKGKITGAVFTGEGRVLAIPRDPTEKASLGRFLGAPLLDEGFENAYFRFDDNTAAELQAKLRAADLTPVNDPSMAAAWNSGVGTLNRWHSLRLVTDLLATQPLPYFYAGLGGQILGPFDILVDDRLDEQILIGQPKTVNDEPLFDSWASFRRAGAPEKSPETWKPSDYSIETSVSSDLDLDGKTAITLRALRDGERVMALELSSMLRIESVTDDSGRSLEFFQSDPAKRQDIAREGDDVLFVVFPEPSRAGQTVRLHLTYHGRVIAQAGVGVFYVGARGSWYPHTVDAGDFTPFDLHFRWPRQWELVATGNKISESEAGDWREGEWRSATPYLVAGFNLGDYRAATVKTGSLRVTVYANADLEHELYQRLRPSTGLDGVPQVGQYNQRPGFTGKPGVDIPLIPPSPTALLTKLGGEIAEATQYFERFNGPFPFERLEVSQIPGTTGQGFPGLLYIPTFSFLSPGAQRVAGLTQATSEHFTDIVPYHEVAHQWWGNVVGWESYRDQWITEGVANYIALLFADGRKESEHALDIWLERYRKDLLAKPPGKDRTVDSTGPLALGYRLRSSLNPEGYEEVIYPKGTWVFHMLRMMLRDPGAADPDARFTAVLRGLIESHRDLPVSTDDLRHAVEKVMSPAMDVDGNRSMDWFFDEWVRSTGIPRYKVDFTATRRGNEYVVKGVLHQSEVPTNFVESVPLYATRVAGKPALLGHVFVGGSETSFQFVTPILPKRLLIDPESTILCQKD
jgi:hypothetical protein